MLAAASTSSAAVTPNPDRARRASACGATRYESDPRIAACLSGGVLLCDNFVCIQFRLELIRCKPTVR
jgi:hypothetical protein